MARPPKEGLDYFSFDVDFFENRKVKKVMRACGPASAAILSCLLCNIYRWKGYYILWDEDLPFDIADQVGVSEGAVSETIAKAVQVGFFDQGQYERNKILTSSEIQTRWKRVAKDSGRNNSEVSPDFSVETELAAQITGFPAQETKLSGEEMPQRRVKKSIVKEKREGHHASATVFYDAEKLILENPVQFEKICCAAPKNFDVSKVKEALRKYHLYLEEKQRYPMTKLQISSGFERWILNEKNFSSGNGGSTKNNGHQPVITGAAEGAGTL